MLIFFCMPGCEKSALQNTVSEIKDESSIAPRTVADCEDCPNEDDCCCGVWLQNPSGSSVSLDFCGTSDGTGSCPGAGGGDRKCTAFSNGGQNITLTSAPNDYRKLFCVVPGSAFSLYNTSSTTNANVYLSCQHDLLAPQILTISIPPNSTYYYQSNGSCYLTTCTP